MKKGVLVAILAVFAAGGVFAQEWYNSYAPGIDESKIFVNVGIGYGYTSYGMGVPPITAKVDFKLPIQLPITVGAFGTFSTWTYNPLSSIDVIYTNIGFGARGDYHIGVVKNLDLYAGLALGYVIQTASVSGNSGSNSYSGEPFFLWGPHIGARYFFTKNVGIYTELGYSGLEVASIGLALKF